MFSVVPADLDRDGDADVVFASYGAFSNDIVAWHENTDGKGKLGPRRVIGDHPLSDTLSTVDLDGDSDVDVLVGETRVTWHENSPLIGDVNADKVFNSSDLVIVFQAGKYEDGLVKNSTFADGDWNGDLEFDSSDLVLAFQAGTYVAEARVASQHLAVIDSIFGIEHSRKRTIADDVACEIPLPAPKAEL